MRLGDVLAQNSGDPRPQPDEVMRQPTVAELCKHLSDKLGRETGGKPIFGPERPPQKGE